MSQDSLYAIPRDRIVDFVFDEHVVHVFDDMIQRSVPGYATIVAMLGLLAEQHAQPDSRCYDLGCSLGAATLAMRRRIRHDTCRIIAVDNSPAMVERAAANIARDCGTIPVDVQCADIRDISISNASVVVLNFTLQFLAPEQRLGLLETIYHGLRPGGVVLLSEKITFADPTQDAFHQSMHHAFKRANGYSDLEISQKRTALENVLIPDTLETHRARLQTAGFSRSELWFQCFNFAALIAHK